jgi:tRNA(Ile2) C34 agmatinyltransferase TiaS
MLFIAIDDTDSKESRGTGRLARDIAAELSKKYQIYGVTRHQLFFHPDIPFTSHNSSAVIHANAPQTATKDAFYTTKKLMLADFVEGSDPGLAIAHTDQVTPALVAFGQDAKSMIVTKQRAEQVAQNSNIQVEGLGGTNGGIIGAIAGIGLASTGSDGRFLLKGRNRELVGTRPVAEVMEAGIDQVMTLRGDTISQGYVTISKNATPSLIHGKAILFVERNSDEWLALKRA